MPDSVEARLASWREEKNSAYLYQVLAEIERGRARELFRTLEAAAEKQAGLWSRSLAADGVATPPFSPAVRTRLVARLLRLLGPRHLLPILAAMKVRGLGLYRGPRIPHEEPATSELALIATPAEQQRHRAARGGGALRAAVFGVNDGLVSNASLILGMSGAAADAHTVAMAGMAGLVAGGLSMAAGEYLSVTTQREVYERQIGFERAEIDTMPEEEIAELTEIYIAKGLAREQAAAIARRIIADPEIGLITLAREELGLDPASLGSPLVAALSSFLSFAVGASIPLLPIFVVPATFVAAGAAVTTALALLGIGAAMSLFTGRSVLLNALRMALIGGAAFGATYVAGRYFGGVAP